MERTIKVEEEVYQTFGDAAHDEGFRLGRKLKDDCSVAFCFGIKQALTEEEKHG